MQLSKVSLNKQEVAYLIHGQPFFLDYEISGAKYVIIKYKQAGGRFSVIGKYRLAKPSGSIKRITNAYSPTLTIYAFSSFLSLFPKIFYFKLKIDFVNTVVHSPLLMTDISKQFSPSKAPKLKSQEPSYILPQCAIKNHQININQTLIQYP